MIRDYSETFEKVKAFIESYVQDKGRQPYSSFLDKQFKKELIEIQKEMPHALCMRDFYICYLNNLEDIPKCPVCGSYIHAYKGNVKFANFCSKECSASEEGKRFTRQKREETCLAKYGAKTPAQSKEIKEKTKQYFLSKYGVENPYQSEEVKEKIKQTCIDKFGVEYASQAEEVKKTVHDNNMKKYGCAPQALSEVKEKHKQTLIEKYGVESYMQTDEYWEKYRATCKERYGVEYASQSEEFREKVKETCQEKFGVDCALQSKELREKGKQTSLKKYGKEYYTQTEEYIERAKQTNLEKYGSEWYLQTEECKRKKIETAQKKYGKDSYAQTEEAKERYKKICQERFGADNVFSRESSERERINKSLIAGAEKNFKTRKINGTLNTSKIEELVYEWLCNEFSKEDVIMQYKEERYPWHCDFYIKSLDLFIEVQSNWHHGLHPYNESNAKDNAILDKWKNRYMQDPSKLQYLTAINVWTVADMKKRNKAKENNLMYFEYFGIDIEDFKLQFKNYIEKACLEK